MHNSSGGLGSGIVIVILIVIVLLVRQGRKHSNTNPLVKGERVRPIAITLLDPLISLVVIGSLCWHLASQSALHFTIAILGGCAGVVIGWLRSRVMYVRTIAGTNNIVLRRSTMEYGLLGLLIIIRSVESSLIDKGGAAVLLLCALVALGVVESISRAVFIYLAHLRDKNSPGEIIPQ